jgi:hypothetical protein
VLQTIATILALAAVAVLAGCGTSTTPTPGATAGRVAPSIRPTPGATAGRVAPSTQVLVIRHGEKPDDTNPGVHANGNQNDTSLTELARWALFTYLMLALCLFTWAVARPAPPAGPGSAAAPAGGGTSPTPTPGATAGGVAPSTLVMVIRHACGSCRRDAGTGLMRRDSHRPGQEKPEATTAACPDDQQVGGSAELDEHLDRVPGPQLHLHVPRPLPTSRISSARGGHGGDR